MLAKRTDARRNLADHAEFDTLTRPQGRMVGQKELLGSQTRWGPRAQADVRQRKFAQIEAARGLIQWLNKQNRLVCDMQRDTESRDKP